MKRVWGLAPVMAGLLLGGCATVRTPVGTEAAANPVRVASGQFASTPSSRAMYDVLAAEMAGQAGDAKTAIEYYRKAMRALPDPALAQRTMEIATFLHDESVALEAAGRWAALAPNDARPQQALGILYARQGEVDKAALHLSRFVSLSGQKSSPALLRIGALLAQTVQGATALPVMHRLISDYPQQAGAQYAYGVLALQLGAPATALDAAEHALALQPGMSEALGLKAQALMSLGHQDRALDLLKGALNDAPDSVALRLAYARLLVSTKDYSHARAEFHWLLKRDPNNPDVLYTLGLLDFELKRDREAGRYLQRVAKAGYHVSAAQYFLGRIAERGGDMESALNHYANVDAGEYQFDAQVRIAYILARQGDLDQAREYLSELRASVSDNQQKIGLYLVEGELLQQADDAPTALKLYNKALRTYPEAARLLYARALVADSLGDLGQAEADLTRVIQDNPKDAAALNALGYTLANQTDRYAEALGYIQRALALSPSDPAILDSMGWVQYKLKHYPEAVGYLERAYAGFPDPEVASHLIQALVASGERTQARAVLDKALKAHPGDAKLAAVRHQLGL
ncbi:tetratricopeptide repeat protein [Acidihalobacter yilgarnensis]|nr:tetratricopeptide repeat protein [Acidihalobacter yilgarnensis]